ncbi:hypothetical protein B0I35DRAFT_363364 [Stachybotrys elegans]|uniref:Uncharacterized protein n=1 Tax=Stachybotrys elegans TaxID=80388 RepID=A0A8K0WKS5_9HYPO|nr:hypothetical protein B0I35DRAFT_363364 [Stachybotrys elegans]
MASAVPGIDCEGSHVVAFVGVSAHATKGSTYRQPTPQQRLAATCLSGRVTKSQTLDQLSPASTFPAPLVLPGDELEEDPEYPPQSLCAWAREKERNPITSERRTLYVIDAPEIDQEVADMRGWIDPVIPKQNRLRSFPSDLPQPRVQDITNYLAAFYHGLDVKSLPSSHYRFVPLGKRRAKSNNSEGKVGLAAPDGSVTAIRHRPSKDGVAIGQLNLLDLLDVLDATVPADAYAVVLLVHHDTYESDEDDFCCGRAFGGSRISVVSSFRYHPGLDLFADVEHLHAWPASHCISLVDYMWDSRTTDDDATFVVATRDTPMSRALKAATKSIMIPKMTSKTGWAAMWLARTCRTASHELGHCFGLDHCVYYACVMQGVATISEDARQPPYLCAVCLSKLAFGVMSEASGTKGKGKARDASRRESEELEWVIARYKALAAVCITWGNVGLWKTFHAWITGRLEELDN